MKKLNITILSKNRASQLQALIESLFLNIKKYYPLSIKVLYDDYDVRHYFNPNSYRKLKSIYSHIEFTEVKYDKLDLNEYLIKDELNLVLTDNTIFTLPVDLYEIGSIDFNTSVLDLLKGINRQKNTDLSYRYDAHKWKQDGKLYYIENNEVAFENVPLFHQCVGKIFISQDKNINELNHYFFSLSPCFINNINFEEDLDKYEIDEEADYCNYAFCTRFLQDEYIDINEIQGYSPSAIFDNYRFKFVYNINPKPLSELIPNVIYLNLEERTDRKEQIENECSKLNLHPIRFNAYKLSDEDIKPYIENRIIDEYNLGLAPARIGTAKSHLFAIQTAKDNNWDNVLILEDDAKFLDNAELVIRKAFIDLEKLPKWDMLYLGANSMDTIKQLSGNIGKITAAFCGNAYIVNKHFYDTILSYDWNEYLAIDQWYLNICRDSRFTIYTVLPIIATQRPSFSNIENKDVDYENVLIDSYKNTLNKIK